MALTFRDTNGAPLSYDEMDSNWRFFTGSFTNTGTITATNFTATSDISSSGDIISKEFHVPGTSIDGYYIDSLSLTKPVLWTNGTGAITLGSAHPSYAGTGIKIFATGSDSSKGLFMDGYGNITASGDVSSSADIYGVTGSFLHLEGDGSQITGVTGEWDGTHTGNAQITGSLKLKKTGGSADITITPNTTSAYIATENSTRLLLGANNGLYMTFDPASGMTTSSANFIPSTNNYDLGSLSNRWGSIYGVTGSFSHLSGSSPLTIESDNFNVDSSGNITLTGSLITSGSRVKHFTDITTIAPISSPVEELSSTDELVFITNNNSSAAGTGEGNLGITNWYSSTDPGTTVECVVVGGTGTQRVTLRYETMGDPININGTSTGVNGVYQITNSQGATAVGSSFKITNLGNLSASLWGTGIYP